MIQLFFGFSYFYNRLNIYIDSTQEGQLLLRIIRKCILIWRKTFMARRKLFSTTLGNVKAIHHFKSINNTFKGMKHRLSFKTDFSFWFSINDQMNFNFPFQTKMINILFYVKFTSGRAFAKFCTFVYWINLWLEYFERIYAIFTTILTKWTKKVLHMNKNWIPGIQI